MDIHKKYRLTLLDHTTGRPIAEELYNKKDPDTIKKFLKKHLDPNKINFCNHRPLSQLFKCFRGFFRRESDSPVLPFASEQAHSQQLLQLFICKFAKSLICNFPRKNNLSTGINKNTGY